MTEPVRVMVETAAPYPVIIGRGLLTDLVDELVGVATVAIFHQPPLAETAEALRHFGEQHARGKIGISVL